MKRILTLAMVALGCAANATIWQGTLNLANLQTLITSSSVLDGDTINLPAGTTNWTSTLSITKAINLIGAGTNTTIINNRAGGRVILWKPSNNLPCRLSGIRFNCSDTSVFYTVFLAGIMTKIRIDHCWFDGGQNVITCNNEANGGNASGPVWGLVDYCSFRNCMSPILVQDWESTDFGAIISGKTSEGATSWSRPFTPGTTNALYIENCHFFFDGDYVTMYPDAYSNTEGQIYGQSGPVAVIRSNLFDLDNAIDGHNDDGNSIDGGNFSVKQYEIYNNTVTGTHGAAAINLRGGKHLIFNNTFLNTVGDRPNTSLLQYWDFDPPQRTPLHTVSNTYYWNNTLRGSTVQSTQIGPYDVGPPGCRCSSTYIHENTSYLYSQPTVGQIFYPYQPLGPHPLAATSTSVDTWWAKRFGGTGSDTASAVATDGSGNIYLAGTFNGTANFGGANLLNIGGSSALVVAKYNSVGAHQWSFGVGGTAASITPTGIGVDSSGNIFVAGYFGVTNSSGGFINLGGTNIPNFGQQDCFLAKYSPSGAHLWSRGFGSAGGDFFNGLAMDSLGNVWVTGFFQGSVNFGGGVLTSQFGLQQNVVLAKYNTNGSNIFSQVFLSSNLSYGWGIGIDSTNNVIITGEFCPRVTFGSIQLTNLGNSITPNIFVAKFNSSGSELWARRYGGTHGDRGTAITVDPNGDVAIGGMFSISTDLGGGTTNGTGFSNDMFVSKYSGQTGSYIWGMVLLGDNGGRIYSMATDSQSNICAAGYYYGRVNFGGDTFTSVNGSWDGFLSKYSSSGSPAFARSYGGLLTESAMSVTINPAGHPVVAGFFNGTAAFYTTNLYSQGGSDAFLLDDGATVPAGAPYNLRIQAQSLNLSVGSRLTLTAQWDGGTPTNFQWFFNSNVISGAITNPFSKANAQLSDSGYYQFSATNAYGGDISAPVYVSVTAPNTNSPGVALVRTNYSVNFTNLTISDIPLIGTNKMMIIVDYTYSTNGAKFTSFSARELDRSLKTGLLHRTNYYNNNGFLDLWFGYPVGPTNSAPIDVTCTPSASVDEGASFAILLTNAWFTLYATYTNALETPAAYSINDPSKTATNVLNVPSSENELIVDVLVSSAKQFTPFAGQTNLGTIFLPSKSTYLHASCKQSSTGTNATTMGWWRIDSDTISHVAVAIKGPPPPQILTQPLAQTNLAGATVALASATEGSDDISHQWAVQSTAITSTAYTGTQNTNLSLPHASWRDSGYYSVLTTNPVGIIDSEPVYVQINHPPPKTAGRMTAGRSRW